MATKKSEKFIPSSNVFHYHPLVFSGALAMSIGVNDAIIIEKISYMISCSYKLNKERIEQHQSPTRNIYQGRIWIYHTHKEWQHKFPFWSCVTVARALRRLTKEHLLISKNLNRIKYDHTKWYSINYRVLTKLEKRGQNSAAFDNSSSEIQMDSIISNQYTPISSIQNLNNNSKLDQRALSERSNRLHQLDSTGGIKQIRPGTSNRYDRGHQIDAIGSINLIQPIPSNEYSSSASTSVSNRSELTRMNKTKMNRDKGDFGSKNEQSSLSRKLSKANPHTDRIGTMRRHSSAYPSSSSSSSRTSRSTNKRSSSSKHGVLQTPWSELTIHQKRTAVRLIIQHVLKPQSSSISQEAYNRKRKFWITRMRDIHFYRTNIINNALKRAKNNSESYFQAFHDQLTTKAQKEAHKQVIEEFGPYAKTAFSKYPDKVKAVLGDTAQECYKNLTKKIIHHHAQALINKLKQQGEYPTMIPCGISQEWFKSHKQQKDGNMTPLKNAKPKKIRTSKRRRKSPKKRRLSKSRITKDCISVIKHYNKVAGRHHMAVTPNGQLTYVSRHYIASRLKQGYTVGQCKQVIDNMAPRWLRSDNNAMRKHFDPSVLFTASHFEKYLTKTPRQKFYRKKANYRSDQGGHSNGFTNW